MPDIRDSYRPDSFHRELLAVYLVVTQVWSQVTNNITRKHLLRSYGSAPVYPSQCRSTARESRSDIGEHTHARQHAMHGQYHMLMYTSLVLYGIAHDLPTSSLQAQVIRDTSDRKPETASWRLFRLA